MGALSAVARRCPGLFHQLGTAFLRQGHWLHHLAQHTVGQNHGGHPPAVRGVKSVGDQVHHLLDRRGREHQNLEVPVARGFGGLPVVRLRGLNAAQSGPAPLHVDD